MSFLIPLSSSSAIFSSKFSQTINQRMTYLTRQKKRNRWQGRKRYTRTSILDDRSRDPMLYLHHWCLNWTHEWRSPAANMPTAPCSSSRRNSRRTKGRDKSLNKPPARLSTRDSKQKPGSSLGHFFLSITTEKMVVPGCNFLEILSNSKLEPLFPLFRNGASILRKVWYDVH